MFCTPAFQSLFRRTLPERVVADAVALDAAVLTTAALFVAAPVALFLAVLVAGFFDDARVVPVTFRTPDAAVVLATERLALRTTVDVLASLDSLVPLVRLVLRAAAAAVDREAGAAAPAAAPRPRVRAVVAVTPPAAELAVDDVVGFREVVARVLRAFPAVELIKFVVDAFIGDIGLTIDDFMGEVGTGVVRSRSRGFSRELEDAGERT